MPLAVAAHHAFPSDTVHDGLQDWISKIHATKDPRLSAALAEVKMFDTRELVNFAAHCDAEGRETRQRNGMISQRDMSDFIENLIPGKSCMSSLEMPHQPLSRSLEV